MRKSIFRIVILLLSCMVISCSGTKKTKNMKADQKVSISGPEVIIYQTKNDYSQLVPVILSNDKKSIESYPDIKDIYYHDTLAYPTRLHNGYWLDNRGIGKNVAFIKLTYDEYAKLPKTPSPEELLTMIIDNQPLVSMYSCGVRSSYENIEKELNDKIDSGDFSTYTKIK